MATKYRIHGYEKIEIGDCGANGAMGGSLTEIDAIVPDSVIFEVTEPEIIQVMIEKSDEPDITDIAKGGLKSVALATRDTKAENLILFLGGTSVPGPPVVWTAPIKTVKKFQSVKITGKYVEGHASVVAIPKVLVIAKLTGAFKGPDSGIIEASLKVAKPIGTITVSTAQVIDDTTEILDITNPRGINGCQITITQNSSDALDVSGSVEGHAFIQLADTTASKNNVAAIQAAIRALGSIGTTDFTDWVFESDGWDGNVTGDVLGTANDTLADGDPLAPYTITNLVEV